MTSINRHTAAFVGLMMSAVLASAATAGLTIGGFNVARGGALAILDGGNFVNVRAAITGAFPGTTFTGSSTLTPRYLATIDILFVSSATGANSAITPLSPAEQSAVSAFVSNGGRVVFCTDNDTFAFGPSDAANESLLDPFSVDTTGTGSGWAQPVTVVDPSISPVTDGPFGMVFSYSVGWTGWFDGVPGNAQVVATVNQSGLPGLLVFPYGALDASSGAAVLFSDSTMFHDSFFVLNSPNGTLLRNTIAFLAGPPCPADLDGNGTVDAADLAIMLGAWGTDSAADLDDDGNVGGADLAILLGAWGPCT